MPRVAVIGAGAAGSIAAIFAAAGGAETLLFERTPDGGRKILISGGGRCNILPARLDESRFVTDSSPHTLRKMLRAWPLAEQVAFFEQDLKLPLVEEPESAKLFPASHRARDVRDRLFARARALGVTLVMGARVTDVSPHAQRWRIERAGALSLEADAVILATGGLSVPSTGSDGGGLAIAERLGHAIHLTYPALTAIHAPASPFAELAGISVPVAIEAKDGTRRASATGGFLFTHRGYSGPAVLDVSHVVTRSSSPSRARLAVRWGTRDEVGWDAALRATATRAVGAALHEELPERLARALAALAGIDATMLLANLRRDDRRRLVETLVRCELPWSGHAGYKSAEVTGGGVSLAEVHPRTMESRRHCGLFLCGEMLDAFGPIGGYNFYWAWATGRAAGIAAAASR